MLSPSLARASRPARLMLQGGLQRPHSSLTIVLCIRAAGLRGFRGGGSTLPSFVARAVCAVGRVLRLPLRRRPQLRHRQPRRLGVRCALKVAGRLAPCPKHLFDSCSRLCRSATCRPPTWPQRLGCGSVRPACRKWQSARALRSVVWPASTPSSVGTNVV